MATTTADQMCDTIQLLKNSAQSALANESVNEFDAFERYLNEVEAYVRELQQAEWADEARTTIRRLQKGEALTAADREVLRAFLVADAEAYLAHENNYDDWVHELRRLLGEVEKKSAKLDRKSLVDLRGILKDAIRLVPDIRNFLTEKQRVEKFDQAMSMLDQSSRQVLERLLNEQLRCSKR